MPMRCRGQRAPGRLPGVRDPRGGRARRAGRRPTASSSRAAGRRAAGPRPDAIMDGFGRGPRLVRAAARRAWPTTSPRSSPAPRCGSSTGAPRSTRSCWSPRATHVPGRPAGGRPVFAHRTRRFPRAWEPTAAWRSASCVDVAARRADLRRRRRGVRARPRPRGTRPASYLDRVAARLRRAADRGGCPRTTASSRRSTSRPSLSPGRSTARRSSRPRSSTRSRIGERHLRMLRAPSAPAPWTSYELAPHGAVEVDVDGDLLPRVGAGIALFLGLPRRRWCRAPEFAAGRRARPGARRRRHRPRVGRVPGARRGLIYVLTHLATLWEDRGAAGARRTAERRAARRHRRRTSGSTC